MNKIPIAFAFDNNLVFPACVCLSSLMMHAKEDTFYDIFILHSEHEQLNCEELDKLPNYYSNCSVTYRTVGNVFDEAFEIRGITTAAYYRLLIPELIPEYDKVIYSDVDVIFRMDLSELYSHHHAKDTNYLSKNITMVHDNRFSFIVFRLETVMTVFLIKTFYSGRIIDQGYDNLSITRCITL